MKNLLSLLFLNLLFSGSAGADIFGDSDEVATLYRTSVVVPDARYHIATFDADDKKTGSTRFAYNFENCQIAAELFQNQPGVKTKFWCEKGYFRE